MNSQPKRRAISRRGCFIPLLLMMALSVGACSLVALNIEDVLRFAYRSLDVSQPPQPADVLVALGGSGGTREARAVELYHEGYAPLVLVSGTAGHLNMERGLAVIEASDIPDEAVIINGRATNTYDEAQQVIEILISLDAESALIITDAHHTRRAMATYLHLLDGRPIELTFVAAIPDILNPDRWWEYEFWQEIAKEFLKLPYYWFVYGV